MAGAKRTDALETVYGAVVGGLIAAFAGIAVFTGFDFGSSNGPSFWMATVGLSCAIALMVAGMLLADRFTWLGTALLFGSGFTALWSVAISFTVESRWVTLLTLGVATALGIGLGWWKFGRPKQEPEVPSAPAIASPPAPAEQPAAPVGLESDVETGGDGHA